LLQAHEQQIPAHRKALTVGRKLLATPNFRHIPVNLTKDKK
jgi:hypothetical protein